MVSNQSRTLELRRASRRARKWMDSLPREILGTFAVDKALFRAVSTQMYAENVYKIHRFVSAAQRLEDRIRSLDINLMTEEDPFPRSRATAEVYFWWTRSPDAYLAELGRINPAKYHLQSSHALKFHIIANVVEKDIRGIKYLEAGVWDAELIRHCIAENIDPELALLL